VGCGLLLWWNPLVCAGGVVCLVCYCCVGGLLLSGSCVAVVFWLAAGSGLLVRDPFWSWCVGGLVVSLGCVFCVFVLFRSLSVSAGLLLDIPCWFLWWLWCLWLWLAVVLLSWSLLSPFVTVAVLLAVVVFCRNHCCLGVWWVGVLLSLLFVIQCWLIPLLFPTFPLVGWGLFRSCLGCGCLPSGRGLVL